VCKTQYEMILSADYRTLAEQMLVLHSIVYPLQLSCLETSVVHKLKR